MIRIMLRSRFLAAAAAACWLATATPAAQPDEAGCPALPQSAAQAPAKQAGKPSPESAPGSITNADVIKLAQAGLGEAVILSSIQQAKATRFDTSADGLVELKKAGVSDAVIRAMLDPRGSPPSRPVAEGVVTGGTRTAAEAGAASSEAVPVRDPGIYISQGGGSPTLVPLEPTVFAQGKSGGFLTSALTYGLYKAKWKAVVRGARANIRTRDQAPAFYFYFEQKNSSLGNTGGFGGWMAAATSPNEFVLAQMTRKRDSRELVVGEMGAFGGSSGARSEDTVDLKIERLAPGVYKVTPTERLGPGEFCFFYAAGVSVMGASTPGKLFDFGVDPEGK